MGAPPERRSKGIVSWPEKERPRERLLSRGPQALTDAELVAILIYGNEARELIPADRFGTANGAGAAKRRKGPAR